jgi:hypothetical protein
MQLRRYFLYVIAFSSFSSFGAWVPLLKNTNDDTMYFDPARVKKNGDDLHVATYSNYKKSRLSKGFESMSSMTLLSINCAKKTFMIHQILDYEDENLQGKNQTISFQYPKISPIPDNSSVSLIQDKICE